MTTFGAHPRSQGCPPGWGLATYAQVNQHTQSACRAPGMGAWHIARIAGGGSQDGSGYSCRNRSHDSRTLGHVLCSKQPTVQPPPPPPPPPSLPPSSPIQKQTPRSKTEDDGLFWNFTDFDSAFFDRRNGALYVYGAILFVLLAFLVWKLVVQKPVKELTNGRGPASMAEFDEKRRGYVRKVAETNKDKKLFQMNQTVENLERKKSKVRDDQATTQSWFEKVFG